MSTPPRPEDGVRASIASRRVSSGKRDIRATLRASPSPADASAAENLPDSLSRSSEASTVTSSLCFSGSATPKTTKWYHGRVSRVESCRVVRVVECDYLRFGDLRKN